MKKTIGVAIGLVGLSAGLIFNPSVWAAVRSVNLEVNGTVNTIARQDDGKIMVGGEFKLAAGEARQNIARLNADGTLDTNFVSSADASVNVITVSGTNIFACGSFTNIGGLVRSYIAKLSAADGSADPNWNCSGANNGTALPFLALAADETGLYVGGRFTNVNGQARTGIAKVSLVNGSVDSGFTNSVSGDDPYVGVLALNGDSLYLAGDFNKIDGESRVGLAKINLASDAVDTAFANGGAGNDSKIYEMLLNGTNLYVSGSFTDVAGNPATNFAKLSASSGVPDPGFNIDIGPVNVAFIRSLVLNGESLFISGWFTTNIGASARSLAKLNKATGALVSEFSPDINDGPYAMIMAGTDLIAGGNFSTINGANSYGLARLNPDTGALTQNMNIRRAGTAYAFVEQPDGKIVIGGSFFDVNGEPRRCLARLNADWSLDPAFTNGVGDGIYDYVYTLAISGSNLYVGGLFTNAAGQPRNYIAKFNTGDGSLDTAFTSSCNNFVSSIAVEDDKLFIGGDFTAVNGQSCSSVVKINTTNGAIDSSFTNTVQAFPSGIGIPPSLVVKDSSLYVGGYFTNVNGRARSSLVKFNLATGTLDPAFTNAPSGGPVVASVRCPVICYMLLNGSDLYIGGDFTYTSGAGYAVTNMAKISAIDGSLDPAWRNNGADNLVYAMDISGTNLYVGGRFTTIGGIAQSYLAKLSAVDGAVDTAFDNGSADDSLRAVFAQANNVYQSSRAGSFPKSASASDILFVGGNFLHMGSTLAVGCAILGDIDAPPEITTQPQSLSKLPGEDAAFSVTAASGLTIYYRWQKDGTALTDGGRVSGAATTNLAITAVQTEDIGGYRCVVSNLIGAVTSSVATLTVAIPVTGDVDGDGLADLITVVSSNWYVWFSTAQYLVRGGPYVLGISGTPVTGDIDGDGLADLISVVGSNWYVWFSTAQYLVRGGPYDLGISGAPTTGDIDGDGLADLITVVGSNWYVWFSTAQYLVRGGPYVLGVSGTPATGDIDGDGLADLITVVSSNWYVWFSTAQYLVRGGPYDLGISGAPTTGDIDGDGLADLISVVGSNWYVWFSTAQYLVRGGPYTLSLP